MLGRAKFKDIFYGRTLYTVHPTCKSDRISELDVRSKPYWNGESWVFDVYCSILNRIETQYMSSFGYSRDVPKAKSGYISEFNRFFLKKKHAEKYLNFARTDPKTIKLVEDWRTQCSENFNTFPEIYFDDQLVHYNCEGLEGVSFDSDIVGVGDIEIGGTLEI